MVDKTNILVFAFWPLFDKVLFGNSQAEVSRTEIHFLELVEIIFGEYALFHVQV